MVINYNSQPKISIVIDYRLFDIEALPFFYYLKNLPWFYSNKQCTHTRYPDSEILCGKDVNSFIGGDLPIQASASLVDRTSLFTSLVVGSVQVAKIVLGC